MREIYLLNKGDSIDKVRYEYSNNDLYEENYKIFGYKFAILNKGTDDITIVKNYLPPIKYKVGVNEKLIDILSRGFKVDNLNSVECGDIIILNRPTSLRYVVKPLETLEQIASMYGLNKIDIMRKNELMTEKLFVGQILWI